MYEFCFALQHHHLHVFRFQLFKTKPSLQLRQASQAFPVLTQKNKHQHLHINSKAE